MFQQMHNSQEQNQVRVSEQMHNTERTKLGSCPRTNAQYTNQNLAKDKKKHKSKPIRLKPFYNTQTPDHVPSFKTQFIATTV